ncbi:MAG: hypothetical protein AAGH99_14105 [Planctomycetota bacterium]
MTDKINEDDLLANAIPIDLSGEDLLDEPGPAHPFAGGTQAPPPEAPPARTEDDLTPIEIDEEGITGDPNQKSQIHVFGEAQRKAHADHWNRTPNATGTGAIHVKTFVAKLRLDAIDNLDEQVNTWLDAHPEYEVKFVTTSVGKLVGKISEDAIFMNVWV